MTTEIFVLLGQDGVTNGAIYVLLALSLVLVYSVTRIVFVPQGEFVTFGAMTLASIQFGVLPGTLWILAGLCLIVALMELVAIARSRQFGKLPSVIGGYLLAPALLAGLCIFLPLKNLPLILQMFMTIVLVVPIGPLVYRVFFQPLAGASILVLLIAAVAVHLAMVGLALLAFGAEGVRTEAFSSGHLQLGWVNMSGQALWVTASSVGLILLLYIFFEHTMLGKALRATAANRIGARIVGIRTRLSGTICFALAAAIGTISGILISPITTIYYNSGLLLALKGFVGAIVGGLISYPVAAAGALFVGLLEAYASFAASAFKEVIVFTMIIPVLLWRSLSTFHIEEVEEE
ncbi:MAG: branched-chain amino acid ABC transporter permease [Afipia sp.]|nr:branched-chain amino acid ABC transporter permease [Afipia sp.]